MKKIMALIPGMPDMRGMGGFSRLSRHAGSIGAGGPGVDVFPDGTNGPQFSCQTSETTLTFDSQKDQPRKKSWTSPDKILFISINLDHGDGDWEDPSEGEAQTGGGGLEIRTRRVGVSRRRIGSERSGRLADV